MNALLLAAGVGNRLRPYTDHRPKPMLEIFGMPILGYNLKMLAAGHFSDVAINLHYLPAIVRDYIGDGSAWGLRVCFSEEPKLRGTAGALLPLADKLRESSFAIVFGDNINDVDLADLLRHHRACGAIATVALHERENVAQSGVAELDGNDRISRFVEKPKPGETASHWVNAGVVIAEPALLAFIPRERASDLGREILPLLAAKGELTGYRMDGGHWWFDHVEDYERAPADDLLRDFAFRARPAPAG